MQNEIKYLDTILHDKRHRAQPMKVKRNAGRRSSDSQHKVAALVNWYSHRIAESMEFDKRKGQAENQRERRREQRRARGIARQLHS